MKTDDQGLRHGLAPDDLDRLLRGAQERQRLHRAAAERAPAFGTATKAKEKMTVKPNPDKQKAKRAARGPESKPTEKEAPPSAVPPEKVGPILFHPGGGSPLPDTAEGLMEVLNKPDNVAHALGAMQKLGELYGRDIVEDNSSPSLRDFNPMIIATGVGSNEQAISSFVGYAVPLRRALARYFQVTTPDVAMMLDMATISYWKAVQAERISVTYLCAALEKPNYIDKLPKLEMVKELAVRQMTRLLESLRVATGRRLAIDPDEDVAKVLRFPQTVNPLQRRARKASAG